MTSLKIKKSSILVIMTLLCCVVLQSQFVFASDKYGGGSSGSGSSGSGGTSASYTKSYSSAQSSAQGYTSMASSLGKSYSYSAVTTYSSSAGWGYTVQQNPPYKSDSSSSVSSSGGTKTTCTKIFGVCMGSIFTTTTKWSAPYCNGPKSWDYYQYSTNKTVVEYKYYGPGDAACAPPPPPPPPVIVWSPEFCVKSIWEYWQYDNSFPQNVRKVRDGDVNCQASVIPPPPPVVTYTEVCSGGTFGVMQTVKTPCLPFSGLCVWNILPTVSCAPKPKPRLHICPNYESLKVGETKPIKVYYWEPRSTSPTCSDVDTELSRVLKPDKTEINKQTGILEVVWSDKYRVKDVTEASVLSSENESQTQKKIAQWQAQIDKLNPATQSAQISNLQSLISAANQSFLDRALVSVSNAGLVTGVRSGILKNNDLVRADYSGLNANAVIKVLPGSTVVAGEPPELSLTLKPALVRKDQTSQVTITVTAAYAVNCVVTGVVDTVTQMSSGPISFVHTGMPEQAEYVFETSPITAKKLVRASCSVANSVAYPFASVEEEGYVELVPEVQEV